MFIDSNDYSVVPVNWLKQVPNFEETILRDLSSIQYCLWPSSIKVTSAELLKAENPDHTWKSYKIKILDNKLYGIYKFFICCSYQNNKYNILILKFVIS